MSAFIETSFGAREEKRFNDVNLRLISDDPTDRKFLLGNVINFNRFHVLRVSNSV